MKTLRSSIRNRDEGFRDDFETTFFYQPLLKWNPNPFTIFYIGGTNSYSKSKNNSRLSIDNSQIYMKFQYLLSMRNSSLYLLNYI